MRSAARAERTHYPWLVELEVFVGIGARFGRLFLIPN